jgi:hypothetical protein
MILGHVGVLVMFVIFAGLDISSTPSRHVMVMSLTVLITHVSFYS